jgi:hypothetical protein
LLKRISENDDTTSRSTHRDKETPQEALKSLFFCRTSLEKMRNEKHVTLFTIKTPNTSLNP